MGDRFVYKPTRRQDAPKEQVAFKAAYKGIMGRALCCLASGKPSVGRSSRRNASDTSTDIGNEKQRSGNFEDIPACFEDELVEHKPDEEHKPEEAIPQEELASVV